MSVRRAENVRYAEPLIGRVALCAAVALAVACCMLALAGAAQAAAPYPAYVTNWGANSVTPINTATNTTGSAIAVGANPAGVAITPDGKTAYISDYGSSSVTPINTATNTAGSAIAVGSGPAGLAVTPDGRTVYVADYNSNMVTPINVATSTAGTPIVVGAGPASIAITPDGRTAYVANVGSNTVTPINIATGTAGAPIAVGGAPIAIAITPDGTTAYVASDLAGTLTPINLATNTAGSPIAAGSEPMGLAISPDGTTAYVSDAGFNTVTPVTIASNAAGSPITVGNGPAGVAVTPDGARAYVASSGSVGFAGNTGVGNSTVSGIASTARLAQGMTVTGSGIPAGTTIAAPPGPNSITLSQAATANASGVALTATGAPTVSPITLASHAVGAAIGTPGVSFDPQLAIVPDQAPVASFVTSTAAAGSPSAFDASASTVAFGPIANYHWSFGDGTSGDTSTPTTSHVYSSAGSYTVTLTETDAAGTSTTRVFTGQTMARNGGPSAQISHILQIVAPPPVTHPPGHGASSPASATIAISSLALNRHGEALIPVSCPADAVGGCRGTITIRLLAPRGRRAVAAKCARGCHTLGSSHYEARAGQKVDVRVHIASVGRALVARRGSVRVNVTATTVAQGQTTTSSRTVTLRARRR